MIRIDVLGTPAAKGSPNARMNPKTGHVIMHESRKTKSWETTIRQHVAHALFAGHLPLTPLIVDKPLAVTIVFRIARPMGHWGTGKNAGTLKSNIDPMPLRKPDIDKLVRATLDPLTGSVFDDDARIVELMTRKEWARPGLEGATILIDEWRPSPVFVRSNSDGMCPPHTFAGSDHQCAVCLKDFQDRDPRVVRPLL